MSFTGVKNKSVSSTIQEENWGGRGYLLKLVDAYPSSANIEDYSEGIFCGSGQIIIKSVSDSKIKKTISIYSVWYNPFWERDVQWIFIKKTELLDNDTIRIYNENGEIFDLKLIKYKVKKIK